MFRSKMVSMLGFAALSPSYSLHFVKPTARWLALATDEGMKVLDQAFTPASLAVALMLAKMAAISMLPLAPANPVR
ncbi:MAG: hypothetical protein LBE21_10135 [Pseudomonadales bacterium]|jgi:hypothetical protein|nr:hypothetical protein [Pseudomonadales bacterium]